MQVEAHIVTSDRVLAPIEAREMSDDWFLDDTVRWIKITSATPQEVERGLAPLELHPRIVHACAHPQPPQVETLEKVLFMAMPLWTPDAAAVSAVRFVAVAKTLITIQDAPVAVLDQQAERLRGGRGRESFSGKPLSMWEIVARKRLPTPLPSGSLQSQLRADFVAKMYQAIREQP